MNIEKLEKQDFILIDLLKDRLLEIEKIKPSRLIEWLSALNDFECETRKYLI